MTMATERSLDDLMGALLASRRTAVLVGAGYSAPDVPPGNNPAVSFTSAHPTLMRRLGLYELSARARSSPAHSDELAAAFVAAFTRSHDLQQAFISWLCSAPENAAFRGIDSKPHMVLVIAWLQGLIHDLVTTNWDFLLEHQTSRIYDEAYGQSDLEAPIAVRIPDGPELVLDVDYLFYLDPLQPGAMQTIARWEIVSENVAFEQLHRHSRPLWKIHGSPFLLYCPICGSRSQWRNVHVNRIGDACPDHPDQPLRPQIVFWESRVDQAYPRVWRAVRRRFNQSSLIVAIGFSGRDDYIRRVLVQQPHADVWVVDPYPPAWWDSSSVRLVRAFGRDLANALAAVVGVRREVSGLWMLQ